MSSAQLSQLANIISISILILCGLLSKEALAQDTWRFRAAMPTARSGVAATILDGKIYVIGGEDSNGNVLDVVEIYDPVSNTWETGLRIKKARSFAAAYTYKGKIHVLGGRDENLPLKQVERFIPDNNPPGILCGDDDNPGTQESPPCWEFIDDFEKEREGITVVELDGVLYALSGSDKEGKLLSSVEFFDEKDDEWRIFESWTINPARFSFATVAVADSAFSIGGLSSFGPLGLTQRYHPSAGTADRVPLAPSRGGLAAVSIGNEIFVFGGREVNNQLTARVDKFDTENNQWQQLAPLNVARENFAAVAIGTEIFVLGGMDGNGNPLNSIETLSLEDIPEVPAPAFPPDNEIIDGETLTLTWDVEDGASSDLQVATASDFSSLVEDISGLQTNAFELSGLTPSTTYFWRIRAVKSSGTSEWSAPRSFETADGLPAAPTLISPEIGTVDLPTDVTLTWQSEEGLTTHLQVSTNEDFSTTLVDMMDLDSSTYPLSALASSTVYYWRTRVKNMIGFGDWSSTFHFTTAGNLPTTPTLISPLDGQEAVPSSVTLTWQHEPAATANLQVSTTDNFSTDVINVEDFNDTSYNLTSLDPATIYYWRVRSKNEVGFSAWTIAFHFTTLGNPPNTPQLQSPADGTLDTPRNISLSWISAQDESYDLQVSIDSSFETTLVDETGLETATYELQDLAPLTAYFWRMRAHNPHGSSEWSMPYTFTTVNNVSSEDELLLTQLTLNANYPNPFSERTAISFTVPQSDANPVELIVFDLLGRKVSTLANAVFPGGVHKVYWDGRDEAGIRVNSGLYVYQLRQGNRHIERKMMFIR